MRYICIAGMILLMALQCPVSVFAGDPKPQKKVVTDKAPRDTAETAQMWNQARKYKKQMRYELARQYYLLALSSCRSDITMQRIQRELQIVELQIRTLR